MAAWVIRTRPAGLLPDDPLPIASPDQQVLVTTPQAAGLSPCGSTAPYGQPPANLPQPIGRELTDRLLLIPNLHLQTRCVNMADESIQQ